MKKLMIAAALILGLGFAHNAMAQNLPVINKAKKTFSLYMASDDDTPLIYGYETADVSSKKMICFSTFTADVDGNPHKCALGAYYSTDEIEIVYIATEGSFVKLKMVNSSKGDVVFYMETKSVKFE